MTLLTSNFIFEIPLYAVSIALMYRQHIILGVVFIPSTGELFSAEVGKGAFCNGKKISVSKTTTLSDAICSVEYYSKSNDEKIINAGLDDFAYFARRTKKSAT